MQKNKFQTPLNSLFLGLCCLFMLAACGGNTDSSNAANKSGISVCNGWNIQSGDKDCVDTAQLSLNESTIVATYALVKTPGTGSIAEGNRVVIDLNTTNLKSRTVVPFTISGTGITVQDIQSMTLNGIAVPVALSNRFVTGSQGNPNQATLILNLKADSTTEGVEKLVVTLDNVPSASVSVDIDDTSRGSLNTDSVLPTILISNQGTIGSTGLVNVAGTASDNIGVTSVAWTNSRGGSGTATVSGNSWTAAIQLQSGINVITFTVTDAAGNTSSVQTTIDRTDTIPPVISVSGQGVPGPTGSVTVNGSVSDNNSVSRVTWTNSLGGSGTATISGNSWTAAITLSIGSNVITFTATDAVGNRATTTTTINRAVAADAIPPTIAVTSQGTISATGVITVYGTVSDNVAVSSLKWRNSSGTQGTGTIYNGTWTANIPLKIGNNSLTFTATDSSGNVSVTSLTVNRPDNTLPVIAVTSRSTINSNNLVTVSGTATDNLGVSSVTWSVNTGATGSATVSGTTSATWTASIPVTLGDNVITFRATDTTGNVATTSITVNQADTIAPTLDIVSQTAPNSQGVIAINGSASDNLGVTTVLWSNSTGGSGSATLSNPNGGSAVTWSVSNITLTVGDNVITFTVSDSAGNRVSKQITVNRPQPPDTTVPTITIGSPGSVNSSGLVVITGNATDNIGVTSVTWSGSLGGSGSAVVTGTTTAGWTANVQLAVGTNVITFTVKDAANNQATAAVSVTRDPPADTTAPNIVITSQGTPDTTGKIVISGTASDNNTVSTISWTNSAGGSGSATITSFGNAVTWSSGNIQLVEGSNVITFTASDSANNNTTTSATIQYVPPPPPDTAMPTITITSISPLASNGTVVVSGTATDNVGVQSVAWNNSQGGVNGGATVSGTTDATWYTAPIALVPGSNIITFYVSDTSANRASTSITIDGATGTGSTSFAQVRARPNKQRVKPVVEEKPPEEPKPVAAVPPPRPPGPDYSRMMPGMVPGMDPRNYMRHDDLFPSLKGMNREEVIKLDIPEPPEELHPCYLGMTLIRSGSMEFPALMMPLEYRHNGWWLLASFQGLGRNTAGPQNFIHIVSLSKPGNRQVAYFYWARQLTETEIGIVPTGLETELLIKDEKPLEVKIDVDYAVLPYQWQGIVWGNLLPIAQEEKCSDTR